MKSLFLKLTVACLFVDEPKDQLAPQLLKGLTMSVDRTSPAAPAAPVRPVDRQSIVGHWHASRDDGSSFDLHLTVDGKFQWGFKQQGREQQLSGNFTLADNFLILSASDQNALVGQVSMDQQNRLGFRLAGGNPNEPGLTFTR